MTAVRLRRALRLVHVTAKGIAHVLSSPGRLTAKGGILYCTECGCGAVLTRDGELQAFGNVPGAPTPRCPAIDAWRELAATQLARAVARRS